MSEIVKTWEYYHNDVQRIKVDGGFIYEACSSICFVPDVDLTRYEAHLRDAYTQGYKAGYEDARAGDKSQFE